MSGCSNDFDGDNFVIFPNIQDNIIRNTLVNDILFGIVKTDIKHISLCII